jgi:hypothetical protein
VTSDPPSPGLPPTLKLGRDKPARQANDAWSGTDLAAWADMFPEQLTSFLPILFLLIVAVVLKSILRSGTAGKLSYERNDRLFSPAERSFLGVLDQILGKEYRIIGKVNMADIIRPGRSLSASAHTAARNKIKSKHVDFAVCDPRTLQVVGVIELDDSSHDRTDRQRRDKFVDAALSSAGVPLVRIPAQRAYAPAEIRLRVSVLFNRA